MNTAKAFNERLNVTGIALTRVDGDARGGAALSMRAVTGCPIKLLGTGEKLDALETFHPERVASRILGMGDVVSLVEKASETVQRRGRRQTGRKSCARDPWIWNDFAGQLRQMRKMGGMEGLMGLMPGAGKMKKQLAAANIDDGMLARQEGDHSVDDAGRAAPEQDSQRVAKAPGRGGLRHHDPGGEPPAQTAPPDGTDGEEGRQARPEGPDAQRHGGHAGHAPLRAGRNPVMKKTGKDS